MVGYPLSLDRAVRLVSCTEGAGTLAPEVATPTPSGTFGTAHLVGQGGRLPAWLDAVRQDDLPSLHTLAAGIDRDIDAVTAGLSLP
ncbi:hypothetical protein ACIRH0_03885 [Streptomyces sp. NPDC093675]|uniref:hypothetical protein n=1 Tax=Streptomyces sp. NPDC093675 TaxID=3366049 RepID=UPI0037F6A71E